MERSRDISILVEDKAFQKIVLDYGELSEIQKAEALQKYDLAENEILIFRQLWLSLDFRTFEQPQSEVEEALGETLWQLASRADRYKQKTFGQQFYFYFSKVAAVLLIPLLIYVAVLQFSGNKANTEVASQLVTITSQKGTVTKLELPDGSKVVLNTGSTLTYPTQFDHQSRKVTLEGEGYFEVVKNKQLPMIISTDKVNLKVYGTSFNVDARKDENFVKVTLVEGSVALSSPESKIDGKNEFLIVPGQTVTFEKQTNSVQTQVGDVYLYTAWKDGLLIFKNNTFETVLKQLSGKFNVDIELKDKSLASIPMDATFRDENINEILRLLSLGTPFKFHYGDSKKLEDGTFAKSKIYIERK